MNKERFSAACAFVMPFGEHKGKTLARIGSNDAGLKYLDWLRGQTIYESRTQAYDAATVKLAINTFLDHPVNDRQLDAALEDDD